MFTSNRNNIYTTKEHIYFCVTSAPYRSHVPIKPCDRSRYTALSKQQSFARASKPHIKIPAAEPPYNKIHHSKVTSNSQATIRDGARPKLYQAPHSSRSCPMTRRQPDVLRYSRVTCSCARCCQARSNVRSYLYLLPVFPTIQADFIDIRSHRHYCYR